MKRLIILLVFLLVVTLCFHTVISNKNRASNLGCLALNPYHTAFPKYEDGYYKGYKPDEKGILANPENKLGKYRPLIILRWGAVSLEQYCKTGNKKILEESLRHARFIIDRLEDNDYFSVFHHNFRSNWVPAGWVSGMVQGMAAELFIRLFFITGEKRFEIMSRKVANAFTVEVKNGGVLTKFPEKKSVALEEYAHRTIEPRQVFNGHIIAAMNLYSFLNYRIQGQLNINYEHFKTFCQSLNFIDRFHSDYTRKGRSAYDRKDGMKKAPSHYSHGIHILGLYWVSRMLKSASSSYQADKWCKMTEDCNKRKVLNKRMIESVLQYNKINCPSASENY